MPRNPSDSGQYATLLHLVRRNGAAGCTAGWLAQQMRVSPEQIGVMVWRMNHGEARRPELAGLVLKCVYGRYRMVTQEEADDLLASYTVDLEMMAAEAA